jgi:hypothetical protein
LHFLASEVLMVSALRLLPRWFRERLILRRVELDDDVLRGVTVKVATTRDEIFGCARLVHDAYVARGILTAHASGLKLGPQLVLPTTVTFVALAGGEVVGTMSLVSDSPLGLPMDASFDDEGDAFRARGERFAEVTALAVAPAYRNSGLVYLLNRLMVRTAIAMSIDRLLMTVHPRAEVLYQTAMLFERIGEERRYVGLNESARAIAMTLPLADLHQRLARTFSAYGETPGNAAWLYFDMPAPNVVEFTEGALDATDRLDAMEALARTRIDVFRSLSDAELGFLRRTLKGVLWPSRSRPAFDHTMDGAPHGCAVTG